ncbi:MAG: aspartate aminotransferase [Candidatus Diapherotrites archaeon CG08_land_8_20_14_0_20_34_12]|nr:MAG: aspartate aminotransferase [Candidatus Diapherotrites archaeon CG08_land_8_20_14_0_20_34_12]
MPIIIGNFYWGNVMPGISERTQQLGTEESFVVLQEAQNRIAKGIPIINFCIGMPNFDTPENIKQAAIKAIKEGKTNYTASAGIIPLKQAVAKTLKRTHGVDVNPDHVVIANGIRQFITYSILAATDAGKGHEVIIPNPGYPIYASQTRMAGANPVFVKLLEKNNFSFDVKELEANITKNTKLLVLNTPHNPCGSIIPKKDMKKIADLALAHDFYVLTDEAYGRIIYGNDFYSIFSIPEMHKKVIFMDGVSKTYAMTGWRLGWAVNTLLYEKLGRMVRNLEACPNHISQYAAIEALNGPQDEAESMVKSYKERRDFIVGELNKIPGVSCKMPGGAFYAFPNITEACKLVGARDSEEFRKRLLDEANIATVVDIHFGFRNPEDGQHMRFSYATSMENLKKGMDGLRNFIEKNRK